MLSSDIEKCLLFQLDYFKMHLPSPQSHSYPLTSHLTLQDLKENIYIFSQTMLFVRICTINVGCKGLTITCFVTAVSI